MAASSRKTGRTSAAHVVFTRAILGATFKAPGMAADVQELIQTTLLGEAAENAPLAIFVADEDMAYIAVNRRACELLGYTRDELLALKVSDVSANPSSREIYGEMMLRGELRGRGDLVRKDRTKVGIEYWAYSTRVAQMTVYVAFVRPADAGQVGFGTTG
jgi:PAS domain S-box-containing protein